MVTLFWTLRTSYRTLRGSFGFFFTLAKLGVVAYGGIWAYLWYNNDTHGDAHQTLSSVQTLMQGMGMLLTPGSSFALMGLAYKLVQNPTSLLSVGRQAYSLLNTPSNAKKTSAPLGKAKDADTLQDFLGQLNMRDVLDTLAAFDPAAKAEKQKKKHFWQA